MSEYQEKFSVTRLIGSPPGYVGYDEGGQLTEAVRHKPYSVVLFDEIEKAHPDVFNILLQVLDDGRLTDNKGRLVNFKNTIIIMTSNLGAHLIQDDLEKMTADNQGEVYERMQVQLLEVLKKSIRPEFLNRIDDVIIFTTLSRNDIRKVVEIQFDRIIDRLKAQEIYLNMSPEAFDWIATLGYDPQYGARPVKRLLQRHILNELSKRILEGVVEKGNPIIVDVENEKLVFRNSSLKKVK
jgi:ATP-dependent Clp protease ATP-binding subunit ClpB